MNKKEKLGETKANVTYFERIFKDIRGGGEFSTFQTYIAYVARKEESTGFSKRPLNL